MKKSQYLTVYLLLSFLIISSAHGQDLKFAALAGRKVTTTVENSSHPVIIGGDGGAGNNPSAGSGPGKTEKAIWETTFSDKTSTPITASKKLKRIIFSVPGPQGLDKYDSDNTFESTDGAEGWVKNFVQVLGKPSVRNLIADSGNGKIPAAGSNTDNVWNNDLPVYDPSLYWNGLTVDVPASLKTEKNAEWKTDFTLNYGTVQNEFTIVEVNNDNIKIKLRSKVIFNDSDKGSINAEGAPAGISLGLQKKQKTFEGTVSVDRKSMLLLSGTFQIETVSVLNINGSGSEQKSYSTTVISNSIGK